MASTFCGRQYARRSSNLARTRNARNNGRVKYHQAGGLREPAVATGFHRGRRSACLVVILCQHACEWPRKRSALDTAPGGQSHSASRPQQVAWCVCHLTCSSVDTCQTAVRPISATTGSTAGCVAPRQHDFHFTRTRMLQISFFVCSGRGSIAPPSVSTPPWCARGLPIVASMPHSEPETLTGPVSA